MNIYPYFPILNFKQESIDCCLGYSKVTNEAYMEFVDSMADLLATDYLTRIGHAGMDDQ